MIEKIPNRTENYKTTDTAVQILLLTVEKIIEAVNALTPQADGKKCICNDNPHHQKCPSWKDEGMATVLPQEKEAIDVDKLMVEYGALCRYDNGSATFKSKKDEIVSLLKSKIQV